MYKSRAFISKHEIAPGPSVGFSGRIGAVAKSVV
jgi:hypothetical protein